MRLCLTICLAIAVALVSAFPRDHVLGLDKRAEGVGSTGSVNGRQSFEDNVRHNCRKCMMRCLDPALMDGKAYTPSQCAGACTEGVRFTLQRQLLARFRQKKLTFTNYQAMMQSATCKVSDAPPKELSHRMNGTPAKDYTAANGVPADRDPKAENGAPREMRVTPPRQDTFWSSFNLHDAVTGMAAYFGNGQRQGRTTTGAPPPVAGILGRVGRMRGL